MNRLLKKYNEMSEPVKASIWYTICNVLNKGIALLSTPIFTRVLSEEQYGTFAIFQSWYSIILIFTSLNIFLGGYQKGLLLFENDRNSFTSSQLGLTTTITLLYGIVYIISPSFWSSIFELPPILMVAMFLELLFMPALEFWAAKEQFDFKYKKYVAVSIIMTVLSLGGGVLAVMNTEYKVEARVYTDVLAKIFFAGILFVVLFVRGKKYFLKKYWKYALMFNIPLIPHYLSNFVLNQSDRVMIGKMIGNDKAALYSVAYSISTMMLLVTSAINNSLTPYTYRALKKNDENAVNRVTKPLLFLVAGLCFITMAFAPEVIKIFGGEKYMDAIYVIPPIAASVFFIFMYSLFSNIEYYFQKTGFIAIATCLSALFNLILNFICIRKYGYYAAGYTTLFCYICLAIFHFVFARIILKEQKIKKFIYDMKLIIILSIVVIIGMIIFAMTYRFVIVRYAILVGIFLMFLVLKNKLKEILMEFRHK